MQEVVLDLGYKPILFSISREFYADTLRKETLLAKLQFLKEFYTNYTEHCATQSTHWPSLQVAVASVQSPEPHRGLNSHFQGCLRVGDFLPPTLA